VRLFIAVFPPPEVQAAAAGAIESLRRPGDGVSWVRRENLHYTMRFMGELGEDGARRAGEAVARGAGPHTAFDAALGGLGAFPDARRARVLWIGLSEGGDALVALARSIEESLRLRGFGRADRPFAAHLTLGRVRDREQDWSERLAAGKPGPARFRVARVQVVQSTLSPKGSIYRVVSEATLASNEG
jgi:2'-5' RNA ligase